MVNRVGSYFPKGGHSATETELKTSRANGNDRSRESHQNILNSSQVKDFF